MVGQDRRLAARPAAERPCPVAVDVVPSDPLVAVRADRQLDDRPLGHPERAP